MENIEALTKLFKDREIWFAAASNRKDPPAIQNSRASSTASQEEPEGKKLPPHDLQLLKLKVLSDEQIPLAPNEKLTAPFAIPEIDQQLPFGGLPFGCTHEWFYLPPDKTNRKEVPALCTIPAILCGNAFKQIIQRHGSRNPIAEKVLLWIGRRCWPAPYILEENLKFTYQEQAIDLLQNCLFIDPPNQKLKNWAIEMALRSGAAAVVVADCPFLKLTEAKRFLLAARSGNALALLIRDPAEIQLASPAASAWSISPLPSPSFNPRWKLSLLRIKGSRSGKTEWCLEAGRIPAGNEYEKISLHIPSELVSGSYQAITDSKKRRA